MRLTAGHTHGLPRSGGFTLLEAVIAAGLLLLVVTAVSLSVTAVTRADAHLRRAMAADRAIRSMAARLGALPYCAVAYPQTPGDDAGQDLVAAVFPHAEPYRNTVGARFVGLAEATTVPAGSFVTLVEEQGIEVRCVASYAWAPEGPLLGLPDVAGWDCMVSALPPGSTLVVCLSAEYPGGMRGVRLIRSAASTPAVLPQGAAE